MTKEITGWEESFNKEFEVSKGPGRLHEKETFPCEGGYCSMDVSEIKAFISKAIASAVEAERAKWVFASEDVRKTMTERFLQDKQNEQINPSKE